MNEVNSILITFQMYGNGIRVTVDNEDHDINQYPEFVQMKEELRTTVVIFQKMSETVGSKLHNILMKYCGSTKSYNSSFFIDNMSLAIKARVNFNDILGGNN